MHYWAILAYDGAAYQGFQRQSEGKPSVQATVEAALQSVVGQPTRLLCAARTDTGVHAAGQVISFDAGWSHGTGILQRALNATLPDDVAIQRLAQAPANFHPRFDAISRTYRYQVLDAAVRHPLWAPMAWHVHRGLHGPLDLATMNEAAALLIGEHDFATFGTPTQGESTIRTLFRSEWHAEEINDSSGSARMVWYDVVASGFLQHMVRALVGALVEVGLGKLSVAEFNDAFQAADRQHGHWMAPPHGLTLIEVTYSAETYAALMDNDRSDAGDAGDPTQTRQTVQRFLKVETERLQ